MKRLKVLPFFLIAILALAACNQVSYKKTKTGLLYKIFPGPGKDSLIVEGDMLKFSIITKLNDSVLYNSSGKMPGFVKVNAGPQSEYNLAEILTLMKKGDSAVVVQSVDSLLNKGLAMQLPPGAKKGDRISFYFRIQQVYKNDSLAMADYNEEMAKDAPRQQKEQEERMEKMRKEQEEAMKKEEAELEKSGAKASQLKEVQDYAAKKNLPVIQTPRGTFVYIKDKGTGPAAAEGKLVTIKYAGRLLRTDSLFQQSQFEMQVGAQGVIAGMDDGIRQFNKGGKGTILIPGFLAYGKTPPAGSPFEPYDALIFDVEIIDVKDAPAH